MSKKLKQALRFRMLVEIVDEELPESEEPTRRGLELSVPKGCTEGFLAQRLEEMAAATFGMLEGDMGMLEVTKIQLLGDA